MTALKNIPPSVRLVLFTALLLTLYFSKHLLIVVLIGIGIGVLLSPLLDRLQKYLKLKRAYATLLVVLGIIFFVLIVTGLFGWVVVDQINTFLETAPDFMSRLQAKLQGIFDRSPWVMEQLQNSDITGSAKNILKSAFNYANSGAFAIGGFVFAIIIGVYLAVDKDYYFEGAVRFAKPAYRERTKEILLNCARVVRTWFRAQLIDMAIIGLITTIGLWIVGVKYWAVFGLLTAVLGIIPYVGIMIVVVMAGLVTLVNDTSNLPWVLLVFFLTQQIEGNLVLPLVMKDQAEIPEAVLLAVMLFFGAWFGLLGVFIAPATVAIGIYLYRELYLKSVE